MKDIIYIFNYLSMKHYVEDGILYLWDYNKRYEGPDGFMSYLELDDDEFIDHPSSDVMDTLLDDLIYMIG